MSFLQLNRAVRVMPAASALLLLSFQVAQADTIFLKCGNMDTLTVDLTNKTVDNVPASITPLSIDWSDTTGAFVLHLHIDRTAGTLTMEHHGHAYAAGTCAPVSQPPTKF